MAEKKENKKLSKIMSFLKGAAQGVSYDFADEGYAAGLAAQDYLKNPDMTIDDVKANYDRYKTAAREMFAASREQDPAAFGAGEMAGGLVGPSPLGKAKALGMPFKAALEGALGSYGASEGETAGETLADVGRGAGFSALMSRMGDIIKFPKKKRKAKAKEIASTLPPPDNVVDINAQKQTGRAQSAKDRLNNLMNEMQQDFAPYQKRKSNDIKRVEDFVEKPKIETLKEILSESDPKLLKAMEQAEAKGSPEPYIGKSYDNLVFRNRKNDDFTQPAPIQNYVSDGKLGRDVKEGGPDPFAWVDTKYGASKNALIANKGKPLEITTRSDLIAHGEYLPLIDKKNHTVNFVVTNASPTVHRVVSPGSPSFSRVLTAAQILRENGVPVKITFQDLPIKNEIKLIGNKDEYAIEIQQRLFTSKIPYEVEKVKVDQKSRKALKAVLGEDLVVQSPSQKLFDDDTN